MISVSGAWPLRPRGPFAAGARAVLWQVVTLGLLAVALPGAARGADFLLGPPNPGTPTTVAGGIFLTDVNAVNEEEETFEFEAVLTLKWQDPRQAFDPAVLGVSERVYQGNYQFAEVYNGWWPQLVLENESGQFESEGVVLRIDPSGSLTLIQEFNAVAEMPMKLRRFPFDRQHFEAIFEVLGFDESEVVLVPDLGTTGAGTDGVEIAQWSLHGITVSARDTDVKYQDGSARSVSHLVFTLDMARQPGHAMLVVVFPLTLLVCLTFTVFWMDHESLGDRMDITFIGILSVVAYQIIVSQSMPAISYFTWMSGFICTTYLLLAAGVVINLVVSKLNQAGRADVGDRVDITSRWAFPLLMVGANVVNALYFFAFH